jgi:hypothetical protein
MCATTGPGAARRRRRHSTATSPGRASARPSGRLHRPSPGRRLCRVQRALHAANGSPLAATALQRIGALYEVEERLRGCPAEIRRTVRGRLAGPLLDELKGWLEATLPRVSAKSDLAGAIRYTLKHWPQLTRYRDDGRLEIDNNAAERAIRPLALGRKNYLFAGSDDGGRRAAAIYTLIETAKMNSVDPEAYLRDVLAGSHLLPPAHRRAAALGLGRRAPAGPSARLSRHPSAHLRRTNRPGGLTERLRRACRSGARCAQAGGSLSSTWIARRRIRADV